MITLSWKTSENTHTQNMHKLNLDSDNETTENLCEKYSHTYIHKV